MLITASNSTGLEWTLHFWNFGACQTTERIPGFNTGFKQEMARVLRNGQMCATWSPEQLGRSSMPSQSENNLEPLEPFSF